ncbi:MAG: efflux transporter outer membrane subunit [Desulfomicrobium sp.]|nr:efflux transporter outer membrane subunit [Pseudomonadota bacterium]MBV1713801.1 efflux transporter outer membrane subunit [Desulfomicrobium sp.]MBU4572336.1 efflux transporter outer membrane subunit [Pseudomonadota bacterium]MBU4594314.1 efflux transporter outer membrane subunit [Pseudomonadota bacterium]MBV1719483.1 efflux transporter outer membrane subunit [Desulfomicrobium sp.]
MQDIRRTAGGRTLRFVTLGFVLFFMAGCAVGPDYVRPQAPQMQEWLDQGGAGVNDGPAELADWWKRLNDPVLDRLVELAGERNPSLHVAALRILEARARLGIATGNQFPQLQQLKGNVSETGLSQHNPNTTPAIDRYYATASVALDAAWELDFWGRFRRAVESGAWSVDAATAGYDDLLVTLTAEVARVYVTLRTLEERLGIARENVAVQERSSQIARALHEGGDVTELDVTQAGALLAGTQASIPRLEAQLRQAKNGLSALLGMLPGEADRLLGGPGGIPQVPSDVAVGVPAELLRRRPDIRAAEAQMAAQCALIGVAKADLYPRFTLFGNIGLSASNAALTYAGQPGGSSLGDLWSSESLQYSGGMGFGWDILNYGRITNNVRVQDARFQQLVEQYKNTVLTAARETEDALSAFSRSREEVAFLEQGVASAKRSVEISMIQYREGLADFQRVLDTQRSKVQAQDQLTATQGSVLINLIATYKALGGGWEARSGKDFLPQEILREMSGRTDWGALLDPPVSDATGGGSWE